jgi:pimeloyl-ACP methyl ester carboxylesterase
MVDLANLLSKHFTVIHYDRRGRGDSMDVQPYALEREIEDIETIIDKVGGSASLYGISSGAALAMEAAIALPDKVEKLAMYEAPYNDDPAAQQAWRQYVEQLKKLLDEGRKGDAVGLFMMFVGASPEDVEGIRQTPMWPLWEAIGHTLAYDHIAALGEDAAVPTDRAARVTMPALIMNGSESFPFMHATAVALAEAMPRGQHQILEAQTHEVAAEAIAPVLVEFFKA